MLNIKAYKELLIMLAVFIVGIIAISRGAYSITFRYEDDSLSGTQATLYYDYGAGFSEEDSSYCTIYGDKVTFPITSFYCLKNICVVPIRVMGQCDIIGADISFMGNKVGQIETGKVHYLKNSDNVWPSSYYDGNLLFAELSRVAVLGIALLRMSCFVIIAFLMFILRHLYYVYNKTKITYQCAFDNNLYSILFLLIAPWIINESLNQYSWYESGVMLWYAVIMFVLANGSIISIIRIKKDLVDGGEEKEIKEKRTNNVEKKIFRLLFNKKANWNEICGLFLKVIIVYVVYYFIQNYYVDNVISARLAINKISTMLAPFNLLWMSLALLSIYFLLGNGLANALFVLFVIVLYLGNIIKISYHNALLTPMDFKQVPDMFRIAGSILNTLQIALIVLSVLVLFTLIVVKRKRLIQYLKPCICLIPAIVSFVVLIVFTKALIDGKYSERFNIGYKHWLSEYEQESSNGIYLYNMFNYANVGKNVVEKPEGYNAEYMERIETYIATNYKTGKVTSVRPNVICVMAESLFDVEQIEGISFNEEIYTTINAYSNSRLISPRYGGYTAAIEYEALTGHSLYFYKDGTMPYTTYYQNEVNSVASEFGNNGYYTIAFHPNTGSFYNREKAYKLMGFDEINTISDITLTEGDTIDSHGYCNDKAFAENVIRMVDSQDEPVFLFGVSIAGHYIEGDHDSDTTIEITDTLGLTEEEKHILEQTADAYQESDEMIRMLIEYVNQCEEPTILYVFGDHLPPLPMWSKLNYLDNPYNKYGTVLLGYSNYKEIEFPEYMTPNYLAAQMLYDAEVEHNVYWNYIYAMRTEMPIFHKSFVIKTEDNAEMIDVYEEIQYDLMFGKKYLLK